MSNSTVPSKASRRRLWPVVVFGVVAVLVIAWTALWFYAAAQAKTEFSAWRERERQAGRQQDCASLSVGGYPLAVKVHCAGADLEMQELPGYGSAVSRRRDRGLRSQAHERRDYRSTHHLSARWRGRLLRELECRAGKAARGAAAVWQRDAFV